MVRLVSPKKSIFSSPSMASGSMEYWVMEISLPASALVGRCRGTYSVRGSLEITTPAAWVLTWWAVPSKPAAFSTKSRTAGSVSYISFSSGLFSTASCTERARKGTKRATRSTEA